MATATSPNRPQRFLIVERPFFSQGGARFYLDQEHGVEAPREGDVVTFVSGPDEDGDVMVRFHGEEFDLNRNALVSVETILALVRTHGL